MNRDWVLLQVYVYIILLSIATYAYNGIHEDVTIYFNYERWITFLSLCYFSFLLLVSFGSKSRFYVILPIVILTVPNAINSIFPAINLSPDSDRSNAAFSFITHIDVFLLSRVLVKPLHDNVKKHSYELFFIFVLVYFSVAILVKFFSQGEYVRYVNSAFQIRYFILLYLLRSDLFSNCSTANFIKGVFFALPVLFLECLISTYLSGSSVFFSLSSGNFANNVLGNLLAFIFLILFFTRNKLYESSLVYDFLILLVLVFCILTGVRGALLSLFVGLCAYYMFSRVSFLVLVQLSVLGVLVLFVAGYYFLDLDYWSDFFNSISLIFTSGYGAEGVKVDATVSSMLTRFTIWFASVGMIVDNLLFGVGFGSWNFLKESYGVPFNVLLDPHNDYIYLLSSYGLFVGAFFIYMLYVKPLAYIVVNKLSGLDINPFYCALFGFAFSSLTNANTSKHQVCVFVFVVVFMAIFHDYSLKMRIRNNNEKTGSII